MKYFAGLDVALEETTICVVDQDGQIVKEARADSEPEALLAVLSGFELCFERIGLEACSLTAWMHEGLRSAGLPAICIESRHAKAAMGAMPNKTDRNDARALAQIMRTGWFRKVHVKSASCRAWRSLLVTRRTVLNEMRTIENVVRAVLREAGLKLGTPSGSRPRSDRQRRRPHADDRAAAGDSRHDAARVRQADQTGLRHCPERTSLPADDERPGRWPAHGPGVPGDNRRPGTVRPIESCRRSSGIDSTALSIR